MNTEELQEVTAERLNEEGLSSTNKVVEELVCQLLALKRENDELWSELRAVRNDR